MARPRTRRARSARWRLGGDKSAAPVSTTTPRWSPDSKKISYVDNSWSLVRDATSRPATVTKIAQEPLYGPVRTLHHDWSPDSSWIAYTLHERDERVQAASTSTTSNPASSHAITDGLERRVRAGLRREREVPLLRGLDRRRSGEHVVRDVQRGLRAARTRSTWRCCSADEPSRRFAKESDEEEPAEDEGEEGGEEEEKEVEEESAGEGEEGAEEGRRDRGRRRAKRNVLAIDFDGPGPAHRRPARSRRRLLLPRPPGGQGRASSTT